MFRLFRQLLSVLLVLSATLSGLAQAPIPLDRLSQEAVATQQFVEQTQAGLEPSRFSDLTRSLSDLETRMNELEAESMTLTGSEATLENLRDLEVRLNGLITALAPVMETLDAEAAALTEVLTGVTERTAVWQMTRTAMEKEGEGSTPQHSVAEEILQQLQALEKPIRDSFERVLLLQQRAAAVKMTAETTRKSVQNARATLVADFFVRDSLLIFSPAIFADGWGNPLGDMRQGIEERIAATRAYLQTGARPLFLTALVMVGLAFLMRIGRHRVQMLATAEGALAPAALAFRHYILTALFLTILASPWLLPEAPAAVRSALMAAALFPAICLLHRLVERALLPVLYVLICFFVLDRVLELFPPLSLTARLLLLLEFSSALAFTYYLRQRHRSLPAEITGQFPYKASRLGVRIARPLLALAIVTLLLGWVRLGRFLGSGVLSAAYLAIVFYAAVQVLDSLLAFAVRVRPLSALNFVRNNRRLVHHRIRLLLRWGAVIGWILLTLDIFAVNRLVLGNLGAALHAEATVGSISISLGDVLLFAFIVYLAFVLSRFIRFILEEDIYPRVSLARGIPYALSQILHYSLLLLGFIFAVAAAGVSLDRFVVLGGAFGVGLGFGLQNVVQNFASGLILLFERPVQAGDTVQFGEQTGEIKRIGIRASVLRTFDGAELIVPNGNLVQNEILNWNLTDRLRRITIAVGVAYGTDPERVLRILNDIVIEHPLVLPTPRPLPLFIGFGESSLDFEIRLWTAQSESWMIIRSDISIAIHKAFMAEKIEIPFPQRDLHIRSGLPAVPAAEAGL